MGKYEIKLFKERMAIHKKLAEGKSLTRDEEVTLLDEKVQNHSKLNFRDFQLLIEIGEEFVFKFRGKEYEIVRTGNDEEIELYKEDGTCDTYPTKESLNNAKIEGQPIREIAEEFKLWWMQQTTLNFAVRINLLKIIYFLKVKEICLGKSLLL